MTAKPVKPLRLGVLISGGGRTLMNLHRLIGQGKLWAEIAVVIASRACKGVDRAGEAGLDVRIVPYRQEPDTDDTDTSSVLFDTYSNDISAILDEKRIDFVVMAGFLSLWHIPRRYEGKVVNIHPALLPAFGGHGMFGRHVHEAVLARGCKVSGCTVHYVTNEYDAGPIILQKCVPVLEGDTPETLAARVFEQEMLALPDAIQLIAEGRARIDGRVVRVS